jgi:hypothetical protein
VFRYFALAVGAVIVLVAVGVLWVDEGEVVTLTTVDDEGRSSVTGLWIVEIDGRTYLRAGSPKAKWLERIRARPEVALTRDDVTEKVRATPIEDVALRNAVSWAMRDKYGFIDAVLVRIIDHSEAVPILVEPLVPVESAGEGAPLSAGFAP